MRIPGKHGVWTLGGEGRLQFLLYPGWPTPNPGLAFPGGLVTGQYTHSLQGTGCSC